MGSRTRRRLIILAERVERTYLSPLVREWVKRVKFISSLLEVGPAKEIDNVVVDANCVPCAWRVNVPRTVNNLPLDRVRYSLYHV